LGIIEDIVEICGKEIKEEDSNIKQILLTFISAFTDNPQNTRILAPSGEGKTYLVTKIAKLFPEENTVTLAKATPQSIKYNLNSKRVVENGPGVWQDYDVAIKPLDEQLAKTKDKETIQLIKQQIEELQKSTCELVDFTNKIIILVDSQSFELFESLKTTLSHDQDNLKSFSVNKSKSGTISGQKFLFRGFPALVYCSAKDEQKRDDTNEINTRFNTISLNTSKKKYRKMLQLEAIHSGLPDSIYQEEVISEQEIESLKSRIGDLIKQIKENYQTFCPYALEISNLFQDDAGYRTRQLKILNNNIKVYTLVNSNDRPKIVIDDQKIPISTRLDIEEACRLTKEPREIQPYKIQLFNDEIKPAIIQKGVKKSLISGTVFGLIASEIAEFLSSKKNTVDRQRLQESILLPLVDHGFLEKVQDPDNKTRNIYYLPEKYLKEDAIVESTLIDISALDESCLEPFLTKYIKQRFENEDLAIEDKYGNSLTIDTLLECLCKIDVESRGNRHKIGPIETTKDIEGEI
jgi:hypothetical protein